MTKAPFSLHCTICFEPFHSADRPPVVLPCGHTYVCLVCSKRLKRCMECREPLFLHAKPPPKTTPTVSSMSYGRWSPVGASGSTTPHLRPRMGSDALSRHAPRYSTAPPSPHGPSSPAGEGPVPLPIPKNLVLMSLMEAAERTGAGMRRDESKGYESGDDDEQVLEGMKLMSSGYGTYVVRAREGLFVYPHTAPGSPNNDETEPQVFLAPEEQTCRLNDFIPGDSHFGRSSPLEISYSVSSDDEDDRDEDDDEDEDEQEKKEQPEPVQCQADNLGNIESAFRKVASKSDEAAPSLPRLEFGRTVQVVSFIDGVAKLSRGRGFVLASSTELVKVGVSVDNTSKIEGMLASLKLQKDALSKKLAQLETQERKLTRDLEIAMLEDEDDDPFTIAPGVAELEINDDNIVKAHTPSRNAVDTTPPRCPSTPTVTSSHDSASIVTPDIVTATRTPVSGDRQRHVDFMDDLSPLQGNISMPSNMDAYLLDNYRVVAAEEPDCPGGGFAPLLFCGSFNDFSSRAVPVSRSTPASPAHGALGGSPERGVDFRTGFSGHLALSSSHAHADRRRGAPSRDVRLMSEHMGIAPIRRMRQAHQAAATTTPSCKSPTLSNPTW